MIFREAGKPSRRRSLIAVAAGLCLISALVGSWALRSAANTSTAPQPVIVSQDAVSIPVDFSRAHVDASSQPATHVHHDGPSSTDQASFKTAGIKRDRPPTWSRSAPPEWWLPAPSSLNTATHGQDASHSRAPATLQDGQERLNRLCIARC